MEVASGRIVLFPSKAMEKMSHGVIYLTNRAREIRAKAAWADLCLAGAGLCSQRPQMRLKNRAAFA